MLVSPSIISCRIENLKEEIKKCEEANIYSLHLDIMDGHFVPNLTIGPDFVKTIRKLTGLKLEAHLMIDRPDKYYSKFLDAGADIFQIHVESPVNTGKLVEEFRSRELDYGIVINPETPFEAAKPFLDGAEILVVMSVHPGFSGQTFIHDSITKLKEAKAYLKEKNLKTKIEIDGGINAETAILARDAGADIAVSGSYLFNGDFQERLGKIQDL